MIGHRRAHRQALAEGEGINRGQVNWALRAFGVGTLYAFASVGTIAAAGSYYLQSTNKVSSMEGFSQLMRTKAKEKMGGFWMRKRLDIDDTKDQETADKVDRMLSEFDEKTGEKKIRFARVKNLMSKRSAGEEYEEEVREPEKLSVGGRMRAAFGFGKNNK
ncbi:hypothetical protein LPJ59_000622 [Coemansia sp. RSA 2399]|nr:hypothetical protein LPJ59_000622 [Coemansia sp. RSA 2399]